MTTIEGTHTFHDATRSITGILAPIERRTLIWLAARMPRRVTSDHLTLLALVAMAGAGASFWMARATPIALVAVPIFLAINWFGDSLDGTIARVRRQQRPRYGFYVDHVVDLVGTSLLLGGMAMSGMMTPCVAMILLVAYVLLAAESFLATHSIGVFNLSYFKIGPTELRIALSIGALAMLWHPTVRLGGRTLWMFDVAGVIASAGMAATFLYAAGRNTRRLFIAEPVPAVEDGTAP